MRLDFRKFILFFGLVLYYTAVTKVLFAQVSDDKTWAVRGYLPDNPAKPVWLTIRGNKIHSVSQQPPQLTEATLILVTDAYIFPGLIDMHNHVKSNILPLWKGAKGQYENRFEWRDLSIEYKKIVRMNLRALDSDSANCAAHRWGELKALVGGAVAIQGGNARCGKGFGVRNLDVRDEYLPGQQAKSIDVVGDVIQPEHLARVFIPHIQPKLNSGRSNYDRALNELLQEHGILEWTKLFKALPPTFSNGLRLVLGETLFQELVVKRFENYQTLAPKDIDLEQLIAATKLNFPKLPNQVKIVANWLSRYVKLQSGNTDETAQTFLLFNDDGFPHKYFSVMQFPREILNYLADFELSVRKPLISYLENNNSLAAIIHLSEGRRENPFNQSEFDYLKTFGLARRGMVIIHGIGLGADDFAYMAKNDMSLVWSPFSNFLFYAETVDIEEAWQSNVNIALGPDWSVGGSKNLLDELKIARRYLRKSEINRVTDRDLINMVTRNAAKALRLEKIAGKVATGFLADLTLIHRDDNDPYTTFVNADQKDIDLVVIDGQPIYGESAFISKAAEYFDDEVDPEIIPKTESIAKCKFQKSIRLPFYSEFDEELAEVESGISLIAVSGIETHLKNKMQQFEEKVKTANPPLFFAGVEARTENIVRLDPLFNCEDSDYQDFVARFIDAKNYDDTLTFFQDNRDYYRNVEKLLPEWSPLMLSK